MAAFPGRPPVTSTTLSRSPLDETFEYIEEKIENAVDGMYSARRDFNTRFRKILTVSFDLLPTADITKITAHFESVGTGTTFTWVDKASNSYTVYYASAPKWKFIINGYYSIEPIVFREQ